MDRYYIEKFLSQNRKDIRGQVLEVQSCDYTTRFGNEVTSADVVDIDESNRRASFFLDLSRCDALPDKKFDCFILTQTLHLIFDLRRTLDNVRSLLNPGGVVLATVPCVSRLSGRAAASDFWRLTPASAGRLFGEVFGADNVQVEAYGNVLSAVAFLTGLAREDLDVEELDDADPMFPVLVAVRAVNRSL